MTTDSEPACPGVTFLGAVNTGTQFEPKMDLYASCDGPNDCGFQVPLDGTMTIGDWSVSSDEMHDFEREHYLHRTGRRMRGNRPPDRSITTIAEWADELVDVLQVADDRVRAASKLIRFRSEEWALLHDVMGNHGSIAGIARMLKKLTGEKS